MFFFFKRIKDHGIPQLTQSNFPFPTFFKTTKEGIAGYGHATGFESFAPSWSAGQCVDLCGQSVL